MPSVVEVATAANNAGSGASVTATWTLAVNEGDLLVLVASTTNLLASVIDTPSGWSPLGSQITGAVNTGGDVRAAMFGRIATAGDSAGGSVIVSLTGGNVETFMAHVFSVTGWSGAIGDIVIGSANDSLATVTFPTPTSTKPDSLIVGVFCGGDNNLFTAEDLPWVENRDQSTIVGSDHLQWIGSYVQAAAGQVSANVMSFAAVDGYVIWVLCIPPLVHRLKRWNGSVWVPVVLKQGASWASKPMKKL